MRAHPPLTFYINSIFLLPLKFDDKIYSNSDCWSFGYNLVYHSGYDPRLILILTRLPFILLAVLLGIYVFCFAKKLYGEKSGYMALILYTFSTAILGYSGLALTDFAATFFIFLTIYYFVEFRRNKKKKYLILTSILLGLAILSKITGFILIPALAILMIYDSFDSSKKLLLVIKNLLVIFTIAFLVMLFFFGFQFKPVKSVMPDYYVGRAYEEINQTINDGNLRQSAIYVFEKKDF